MTYSALGKAQWKTKKDMGQVLRPGELMILSGKNLSSLKQDKMHSEDPAKWQYKMVNSRCLIRGTQSGSHRGSENRVLSAGRAGRVLSAGRGPGEPSEGGRATARPSKPGTILMGGYYCLQFIGPIKQALHRG